ncbi:hypothetical protein DRJ17_01185 [Candidatus Woesearchaeota archaeon]|nr:MAG: hypothetical protein DRJ17_01185 [Candidatus Woesearchaeota archaeon]
MANIRFYPIDITYVTEGEETKILLFGRTDKGEQIAVKDSFEPYFYVLPDRGFNPETIQKTIVEGNRIFKIKKMNEEVRSYMGNKVGVYRVVVNHPSAVPLFRSLFLSDETVKNVFEADILFTRRYLIDTKLAMMTLYEVEGEEEASHLKVPVFKARKMTQISSDLFQGVRALAVDIETYNPGGRYSSSDKDPIIMLAVYGTGYQKIVTWKRFKTDKNIEFVNSEAELIQKFQEYVEEYKPDVIIGYFSDRFDLPYIKKRAEKYKLKLDLGLNHTGIQLSRGYSSDVRIIGICHLDIYQFIFNTMRVTMKTDTYDLSSVSAEILGEEKHDVNIANLGEIWDNSPDKLEDFCMYNLQDARMTYLLFGKLFANMAEMVNILGLSLYDVTRMSFSNLVEWYLIGQAKERNVIVPNKPNSEELNARMNREPFIGAMVLEPEPGLYKDIAVFDFRSLYPSIIASHNIGPDTLNCDCCPDADNVPEHNFHFCKNKKGFISSVIEDIIKRRSRIKEIMKKNYDDLLYARQYTLKTLLNSTYGYFGFYGSRWYSPESGESVTAYARHYVRTVVQAAKENGFKVIYGDTDSVFIQIPEGKTKQDALNFMHTVNSKLPGIIELEFEGYCPAGLFVFTKHGGGAKKKYALLTEDGKIKVVGFAFVRRDWSNVARETQRTVLEIILKEKDPKKAFNYVRDVIEKVKRHEIPVKDVVISTQLRRGVSSYEQYGPHVAVAQRMSARGIMVGPGSMIRYVIVKGNEKIRDRARLVDEVSQDDYDPVYYVNNQVIPAVEQILNIVGYGRDDLLEDKDQSKLESFF